MSRAQCLRGKLGWIRPHQLLRLELCKWVNEIQDAVLFRCGEAFSGLSGRWIVLTNHDTLSYWRFCFAVMKHLQGGVFVLTNHDTLSYWVRNCG